MAMIKDSNGPDCSMETNTDNIIYFDMKAVIRDMECKFVIPQVGSKLHQFFQLPRIETIYMQSKQSLDIWRINTGSETSCDGDLFLDCQFYIKITVTFNIYSTLGVMNLASVIGRRPIIEQV